ncbi:MULTISPECIES: preprotein translocase subunit SecE [Caproicibacterium]|jgi:preprotein translocase subunit SecE|uniref:Preprotein translocase subunit SecE n=1 Tax=Caproicibacterium lactatifermentans TaxID=2666138 RepID=A0A859DMR2_9FIRM|nr:preprotein translocase subunit SecE [Caproicibacterium lactatifermentans]ARP50986.1 preprotein translocase subunit SecE [Ruminococcaceae bacterium CPB6]MDD4807089.1 preprotein translocase subunit SecE [Oscillospiraceae bacterium]QKN23287.1 preprotein translocase subunit SecE [Caproicibacterium lactatifermentans]QKO30031.1 preprotein translocase subunit SecE [Caproicibacterium lactatifermentans]
MADKKKKAGSKAPQAAVAGEKKAAKKTDKAVAKTEGTKAAKTQNGKKKRAVGRFFHDLKAEIKKIVWPAPRAVWRNVGIVVVMIAVVGVCVFGLDEAFTNLLHQFMNVAV